MKFKTINNGEKIAYKDINNMNIKNQKTLVLIHGNMCSSNHFNDFINKLSNKLKDFRIIAPDLRGYGESSYNNHFNTFEELADDVLDLLNLLSIGNFFLIGHYTGTAVAMEISAKSTSRVSKLVLVSPIRTMGVVLERLNANGEIINDAFLSTRKDIESDSFRIKPIKEIFETQNIEFMENIITSNYLTFNLNKILIKTLTNDALKQKNVVDIYVALSNFNISNKDNGIKKGNNKIQCITAQTLIVQSSNDSLVPYDNAYLIKYFLKSESKIIVSNFGHSPFMPIHPILDELIKFII